MTKSYDAIVIGSGMGGLTTAAMLSDLGWKVCVLEQHYTAGGYTHSYERNGYEWDVGLHYVGGVSHPARFESLLVDESKRLVQTVEHVDRRRVVIRALGSPVRGNHREVEIPTDDLAGPLAQRLKRAFT